MLEQGRRGGHLTGVERPQYLTGPLGAVEVRGQDDGQRHQDHRTAHHHVQDGRRQHGRSAEGLQQQRGKDFVDPALIPGDLAVPVLRDALAVGRVVARVHQTGQVVDAVGRGRGDGAHRQQQRPADRQQRTTADRDHQPERRRTDVLGQQAARHHVVAGDGERFAARQQSEGDQGDPPDAEPAQTLHGRGPATRPGGRGGNHRDRCHLVHRRRGDVEHRLRPGAVPGLHLRHGAVGDHPDLVRGLLLVRTVGHVDDGGVLPRTAEQSGQEAVGQCVVEPGGGLVDEHRRRAGEQRPSQFDPLALTARHAPAPGRLAGPVPGEELRRQPTGRQRGPHLLVGAVPPVEHQVLPQAAGDRPRFVRDEHRAVEAGRPAHGPEHRRLAAAGRADDGDVASRGHGRQRREAGHGGLPRQVPGDGTMSGHAARNVLHQVRKGVGRGAQTADHRDRGEHTGDVHVPAHGQLGQRCPEQRDERRHRGQEADRCHQTGRALERALLVGTAVGVPLREPVGPVVQPGGHRVVDGEGPDLDTAG